MNVNFLGFSCNNGETNMRLDEAMLNDALSCSQKHATVRFYGWKPKCVSLGRNQKGADFTGFDVDVVRRITGGRALLHDNELTYSVVAPILAAESVIETYKRVSDGLIEGFKQLNIPLQYASSRDNAAKSLESLRNGRSGSRSAVPHTKRYCMQASCGADVAWCGKKLIGSAQYRAHGYFLQHGSILFDADFEFLENIFGEKIERNSIATMKEIDDKITFEMLIKALEYGFEETFRHKSVV